MFFQVTNTVTLEKRSVNLWPGFRESVVVMYEFGVNASQMTCSILGGYLLQVDGVGVVAAA